MKEIVKKAGSKLEWSDSVKLMKGEDKTLIANIDNAKCLFITNECLNIIEDARKHNMNLQEVIDAIEDKSSKEYFIKLYKKIESMHMWKDGMSDRVHADEMDFSVDLTNDCNLRCRHCCVSAGELPLGGELSTEEMSGLLDKIISINPRSITISGGEPLIREDFAYLTRFIRKKYNGRLILMTNSTLITDELARLIAENYDSVDTSIDGVDEESCREIRGKGTFEKIIRGIKLLKKNNARVSASMVRTQHNYNLGSEFRKICEDLEIRCIFRTFDPSGRGKINQDTLMLRDTAVNAEEIDWERAEKRFVEQKMYRHYPQIFACQGAKREFQIDHRGYLYPCATIMEDGFEMGNALEIDNFREYILDRKFVHTDGYKKFASFLPFNVEPCKDCNKQVLCFRCVNTVKNHINNGSIGHVCNENLKYFDFYWRYYGTC